MKQRDISPFGLRMPPTMKAWVEKKAAEQERSQNWLLLKIIEKEMQRDVQERQGSA